MLAGNTAFSPGAYELISSSIVTGTTTYEVIFSSIPQTYKHLQIRAAVMANAGAGLSNLALEFNSIGGSSYGRHMLTATGAGITSAYTGSVQEAVVGQNTGNSTTIPGVYIIDILDYVSTVKNTTVRSRFGAYTGTSNRGVGLWSNLFTDTSAISRILCHQQDGAPYYAGTRFSLYGIKG
jgi:hypothetical protein